MRARRLRFSEYQEEWERNKLVASPVEAKSSRITMDDLDQARTQQMRAPAFRPCTQAGNLFVLAVLLVRPCDDGT